MLVFIGYPMIQNIILGFKNVDVFTFSKPEMQEFIGLQNYIELFTGKNSILTKFFILIGWNILLKDLI